MTVLPVLPVRTMTKRMNDELSRDVLEMDEIAAKVSSFCDYETKATALRSITKRLNQIIDHELYQHSQSLLPFEYQDRDIFVSHEGLFAEINAKVYIRKKWSPEYRSREAFFQNIEESVQDELTELAHSAVEDGDGLQRAFNDLLNRDGCIKLSNYNIHDTKQVSLSVAQQQDQIDEEKLDHSSPHNHAALEMEHFKEFVQGEKNWTLTLVHKNITLQESLKQLEHPENCSNEHKTSPPSFDEVNTAPLLELFHRVPFAIAEIDYQRLRECLFGLLVNSNPSSIST